MSIASQHTPAPWFDWDNGAWLVEPQRLLTRYEDARLIAAAPELLEAAVKALAALEGVDRLLHQHGMMQGVDCPAIPILKAAIAKAASQ